MKSRPSLEEILQSTSDVLFPADIGERRVEINSKDADGDTPLHVMVGRGDRYAVELLLASGAEVNAVRDMGETPLHLAVSREDAAIVELLLAAGADPNIRSEFGDTPLERAQKKGGAAAKLVKDVRAAS